MGHDHAVDWQQPFRDLVFPADEAITTRLGAADLLVDFPVSLPGPFGEPVARLRLPHWLARGVTATDQPEVLASDPDGAARFRLGERTFRYDRWGLAAA